MIDNERVQSISEMLSKYHETAQSFISGFPLMLVDDISFLVEQLEQRDKTITELSGIYETQYGAYNQFLQQQNALMLSALEQSIQMYDNDEGNNFIILHRIQKLLRDTVVQIKSITDIKVGGVESHGHSIPG